MALAHVEWRYVGSVAFASATVASALDAVYTLGTTGSYADGTSRVQGSSSAWNFTGNRFQSGSITEAVWCTPPGGVNAQTVLMAGSAINQPTGSAMASPDLATTNNMFVNITKGSGSYNNWVLNPPINSGTTFGYWKCWTTGAGAGNAFLWESKECVAVILNTSTGTTYGFIAGAILDPESVDVADAESDGRLYGIICSGVNTTIASDFTTTNAVGTFITTHGTTNGVAHSGVFTPGAGTIITIRASQLLRASDTTTFRTISGKFVRQTLTYQKSITPFSFMGRLRDMMYCTDGKTGQKLLDGASAVGYLMGSHTSTDNDQLILEHS
jgi:hypothetical protein